jgi:hypothetical protein
MSKIIENKTPKVGDTVLLFAKSVQLDMSYGDGGTYDFNQWAVATVDAGDDETFYFTTISGADVTIYYEGVDINSIKIIE